MIQFNTVKVGDILEHRHKKTKSYARIDKIIDDYAYGSLVVILNDIIYSRNDMYWKIDNFNKRAKKNKFKKSKLSQLKFDFLYFLGM